MFPRQYVRTASIISSASAFVFLALPTAALMTSRAPFMVAASIRLTLVA